MAEILFIAIDPVILTLVENLQQLVEPRILLESDYTSGIKRIFDNRPAVVFLQHKIGKVTCDKLANQVKMLLDGDPIPLVLLSDEPVSSYAVVSTYEACFDLCLPFDELSLQVQQLLRTLPEIVWKGSAAPAPRLPGGLPSDMLEINLPGSISDFSQPFPWQEGPAAATTPSGEVTLTALEGNSVTPAGEAKTSAPTMEEPSFLADFVQDRFAIEPLPLVFDGFGERTNKPADSAPVHDGPTNDFPFRGNEGQNHLFWNSPELHLEPSPFVPEPEGRQPAVTRPPVEVPESTPAPGPSEPDALRKPSAPAGAARQGGPAGEARQAGPRSVDELFTPAPARGADKPRYGLLFQVLVAVLLLAITGGVVDLFFTRQPGKLDAAQEIHQLDKELKPPSAPSASSPRAAEHLPPFIPPVPADPAYAESHPGWERYLADAREYLVYRENGRIKAVQVLSEQPGSITGTFLKTSLRTCSGSDHFVVKKNEERSGIQITSGALQNGGELLVYRVAADGEIRGFVIAFPSGSKGAKS